MPLSCCSVRSSRRVSHSMQAQQSQRCPTNWLMHEKRKEKTTPFGANLMRVFILEYCTRLLRGNCMVQVITSCNSTKDELCEEFCQSTEHGLIGAASCPETDTRAQQKHSHQPHLFQHVDHVQTYPKFKFAGIEGTKVCTVAFRKLQR